MAKNCHRIGVPGKFSLWWDGHPSQEVRKSAALNRPRTGTPLKRTRSTARQSPRPKKPGTVACLGIAVPRLPPIVIGLQLARSGYCIDILVQEVLMDREVRNNGLRFSCQYLWHGAPQSS